MLIRYVVERCEVCGRLAQWFASDGYDSFPLCEEHWHDQCSPLPSLYQNDWPLFPGEVGPTNYIGSRTINYRRLREEID